MNIFNIELELIYLKPNEIYIAEKSALVETVLGSCVSITMFDRQSGIGMICHCLLPQCKNERLCDRACSEEFKYVDCSIRNMIEKFDAYDIKRRNIEVKVFGGADMFARGKSISVGKQNIETALHVIKSENLNLLASDLGGTHGRKIFFNTNTGVVHLKRLRKTDESPPSKAEL